jgi:hypothetical protein
MTLLFFVLARLLSFFVEMKSTSSLPIFGSVKEISESDFLYEVMLLFVSVDFLFTSLS